ncbi:unnamed protein product, partial [Larinioides sclopetarius]
MVSFKIFTSFCKAKFNIRAELSHFYCNYSC